MILIPTRGRPENIKRFGEAYRATKAILPVTLLLDADDPALTDYTTFAGELGWECYIGEESAGIVVLINEYFQKNSTLAWYGVLSDDVVPRTDNWDIMLRDRCLEGVIAWPDDKHAGALLATHAFLRGDLVRYLNFISYPKFYHGYVDLLWTLAAYMINSGAGYCKDVVVEHICDRPREYDKEKDKREYICVLPSYIDAIKQFQVSLYNLEKRSEEVLKEEEKYSVRAVLKEWEPKKILICIASGGSSSDTFNIYLQNTWASSGYPDIIYEQSPYIHWNRESCAEYALEKGYEYLMFFDNDMVFPLDIIKRLFSWQKDIVTTNYTTKERPARFMCIGFNGEAVATHEGSEGLERVWMAPTGTMLIHTDVFKKMPQPWFDTSRTHKLGEDYFFTNKCKGYDIEVYCDHTLTKEIGHEGKYIYTWKDAYATDNFCNDKFPDGIARKVVGTKV